MREQIKYSSYENEVPIISSGVNVGPWKSSKNIDRLPEIAKGNVYVTDIPDGMGRFIQCMTAIKESL